MFFLYVKLLKSYGCTNWCVREWMLCAASGKGIHRPLTSKHHKTAGHQYRAKVSFLCLVCVSNDVHHCQDFCCFMSITVTQIVVKILILIGTCLKICSPWSVFCQALYANIWHVFGTEGWWWYEESWETRSICICSSTASVSQQKVQMCTVVWNSVLDWD